MNAPGTNARKQPSEPTAPHSKSVDGLPATDLLEPSALEFDNYSMMANNTISINYSDEKLRILVEEYITQQRTSFTLKGVCSYVLYWAMEDGHTTGTGLYESNQMSKSDCDRVCGVLDKIVGEGRIAVDGEHFMKLNN